MKITRWHIIASALILVLAVALTLGISTTHLSVTHAATSSGKVTGGQLIELSCAHPITAATLKGHNQNNQSVTWSSPAGWWMTLVTTGHKWQGSVQVSYRNVSGSHHSVVQMPGSSSTYVISC